MVRPNGCWEWTGRVNVGGYPALNYRGKTYLAHRVMAEYVHDEVLFGSSMVCHRCDNPPCVNPDHLFIGTAKDNWLDSVIKLRTTHILPNQDDPDLAYL